MSMSSNASNVLLAKCRAKYGRRLTARDIQTLASCRSVAEVAAYLKSSTCYGEALSRMDENNIHRRGLENAIMRMLYEDLSSLCRYELSVGEWFGDYIMMRGEIQQIMSFLTLLAAGRPEEFIFSLPEFFAQHSQPDFRSLTLCRSYEEFLAVMRTSRYSKILRRMAPLDGEDIDCSAIEHALYVYFYSTISDIIDRHYHGKAREELCELVGIQLDLVNFAHIYRLKKYYKASPDLIRSMMFAGEHRIRNSVMRDMIDAPSAEDALEIFAGRTTYGRALKREDIELFGIEKAMHDLLYGRALRLLRSSINPTTVLLSYVTLAETEVRDITTIAEGVHYGLPQSDILKLITITGSEG